MANEQEPKPGDRVRVATSGASRLAMVILEKKEGFLVRYLDGSTETVDPGRVSVSSSFRLDFDRRRLP